jgi:hypothetical protein
VSAGRVKAEHDDVALAARRTGQPLRELAQRAEALWRSARQGPGMTTTGETTVGASGRPARQPQGWFPPGPEGGGNDSA